MWSGGQRNMWLHGCIHLTISHQLSKFHVHRPCQRGCVTLLFVTWPHTTKRIMWFHRWVPLTISSQPAMFGGHRACGRGDIKFSICHVTSRDHVIRGSLWVSFPHHESYFAKFGGHWTCRRGDILLLVSHVTSCDYVIRGSCDNMGEFPSL